MNKTLTSLKIHSNKMLKEVCTFGIGGPSKYYVEIKTVEEVRHVFAFCKEKRIPYFILGKGSNTLFHDNGFEGLVIANKIDFIENPFPGIYHVGSGYSFPLLGVQTAREQWSGLEFASGIPCTTGGAIYMNAGAGGHETCHYLSSVDYLTPEGDFKIFKKEELEFNYRYSSFQKMRGFIAGATFTLVKDSQAKAKQLNIVSYRTKSQPYGEKSAGCVFRNPEGNFAGALIEKSGLKNVTCGHASVSNLHANFIINNGNASCQDVLNLIEIIKKQVKKTSGIDLEVEIRPIMDKMPL